MIPAPHNLAIYIFSSPSFSGTSGVFQESIYPIIVMISLRQQIFGGDVSIWAVFILYTLEAPFSLSDGIPDNHMADLFCNWCVIDV